MKWVIGVLLLSVILISGCSPGEGFNPLDFIDYSKPRIDNKTSINDILDENYTAPDNPSFDDYKIASFNIQVFGKTKAENTQIYSAIVDIIDNYDIIAIQEIRDETGTVVTKLGSIPSRRLKVSDRLGRTISKEQYAFLYSGRVTGGVAETYPDPQDKFEREPFMMDFTMDGFRFLLIQVHIKPDDAEQEIRLLPDVVAWGMKEYKVKDVIIMGDLNADCTYFDSFDSVMTNYTWLILEDADTTVGSTDCAYDRIITNTKNMRIISWGVDYLQNETGGNADLIRAISDHYPVYFIYDKK